MWKALQKAKRKRPRKRELGAPLELPPEAASEEVKKARQARKAAELTDFRRRCAEGTTATGCLSCNFRVQFHQLRHNSII